MATADEPVAVLKQGLASLYASGELSDFTIICGPHTFKVHKVVLRAQSQYFGALPNFAEGVNNSIVLKAAGSGDGDDEACDDPEAIKLMVHFFYHLDYRADVVFVLPSVDAAATPTRVKAKKQTLKQRPYHAYHPQAEVMATVPASTLTSTDGNMVMHAKVFAAAVKYQVPALKSLAASKFAGAVKANTNHDSFAEAAHIVYTTTPEDVRNLRDVVATTLTEHDKLLNSAEIETVVRSISGLAYELLKKSRGSDATSTAGKTPKGPSPCDYCGQQTYVAFCMSGAAFAPCGFRFNHCDCERECGRCGDDIHGRV
ncbi:hypothetical protein LTR36_003959 [Oleoguttula mirabilis]|uniref:BTB domain-containing protein n=1 Tax=Oleoguttula mirabilis TaxID=1507867 RepID=A0AAV9JH47_9PEZI|nr:hypothetical protein LTR36_003959 [Oleoguttula mirabilis]